MKTHKNQSWYEITALEDNKAFVAIDGEIGGWGVSSAEFKEDVKVLGDLTELKVKITSRGGSVFEGMGMMEFIAGLPYRTVASVEGLAGSMAANLTQAFDHVTATKGSILFVHNARISADGADARALREMAADLDTLSEPIMEYYMDREGIKISREDLQAAFDKETYYTAKQALEHGLIDEITNSATDMKAVACLDWDEADLKALPAVFSRKVRKELNAYTLDGSAVPTTEDVPMAEMPEVTSAADQVDAVAEVNKKWAALLGHANGSNVEAVTKIAAMGLSLEQSVAMMDLVAPKVETAVVAEVKEEVVVDKKEDDLSSIRALFESVMSKSDVNAVNTSTGSDDETDKRNKMLDDPAEAFKHLKSPSNGVIV